MKSDISKLNQENCALYIQMTRYLSEKRLKKSEYRRVNEDIVLMLLDAQERGEKAEDLFPNGYENFLNDVVANCDKERWYETLLSVLLCAFAALSAVTFIVVLFAKLWADDGEWVSGVNARIGIDGLTGALLAAAVGIITSVLSSRFAFKRFIYNKKLGYYFYVLLIIAVAISIEVLISVLFGDKLITFNWVALACGSAAAAIVCWLINFLIGKLSSTSSL